MDALIVHLMHFPMESRIKRKCNVCSMGAGCLDCILNSNFGFVNEGLFIMTMTAFIYYNNALKTAATAPNGGMATLTLATVFNAQRSLTFPFINL